MSAHQVIGYTPEIGKALKRILAETPQTDTGKLAYKKGKKQQLLQGRKRTLAGNFEYNGYFKIIDASEYDEEGNATTFKVAVADGATYNPETQKGDYSLFKGNNITYNVPVTLSKTLRSNAYTYVYLKYVYGYGGKIVFEDTTKVDTQSVVYYIIGTLICGNSTTTEGSTKPYLQIIQRHGSSYTYDGSGMPNLTAGDGRTRGMFALVDAGVKLTEDGDYERQSFKVGVVDGDTWDGKESHREMLCTVNNMNFSLTDTFHNASTDITYAYLHFKGNISETTETSRSSVSIEFSSKFPDVLTETDAYKLIGSFRIVEYPVYAGGEQKGSQKVLELHQNAVGNIQMYWWATCSGGEK